MAMGCIILGVECHLLFHVFPALILLSMMFPDANKLDPLNPLEKMHVLFGNMAWNVNSKLPFMHFNSLVGHVRVNVMLLYPHMIDIAVGLFLFLAVNVDVVEVTVEIMIGVFVDLDFAAAGMMICFLLAYLMAYDWLMNGLVNFGFAFRDLFGR